jgi:hypothetical protein
MLEHALHTGIVTRYGRVTLIGLARPVIVVRVAHRI